MRATSRFLLSVLVISTAWMSAQGVMEYNEETAAELASGKYTVAVLDFEGRGISQMEAQTLTDRLSSELSNTNAVILVERGQMTEILDEQGFQQSGCTNAECAAEVGALLGVQFMISGSIGKIGNSYTIDSKMFSVETGATEKSVSSTYKGEIDGLITEIEILAWKLVGLAPPDYLVQKQRAASPQLAVQPQQLPTQQATEKKGGGLGKVLLWGGILAAAGGGAAYYLGTQPAEDTTPIDDGGNGGGGGGSNALPVPPSLP